VENIKLKKIIFFVFCLFYIIYLSAKEDYCIMYVHLGDKIPNYIYDSIAQSRLFNPTIPIYLICYESVKNEIKGKLENTCNFELIIAQKLDISKEHLHFIKSSKHSGFWRFSSERFFYIEQAMRKYKLQNVFHLESDNLLYFDISEYIQIFTERYNGIAATFDNDNRCIAGFMYIKNIDSIHALNKLFAEKVKDNYNDMQTIALFKTKNPNLIDNLPIIPSCYKFLFPLKNKINNSTKLPDSYSKNFDLFNSIFDAAAIGQYLGGTDPIHTNFLPGFINESCIFDPSNFTYKWMLDNQQRKIPVMIFKNQTYKINNLHIHCKNLKKFVSN